MAEGVLPRRVHRALRGGRRCGRAARADQGEADRRRCRAWRAIHGGVSSRSWTARSCAPLAVAYPRSGQRHRARVRRMRFVALTQALQLMHGARLRPLFGRRTRSARSRRWQGRADSRARRAASSITPTFFCVPRNIAVSSDSAIRQVKTSRGLARARPNEDRPTSSLYVI